MNAKYAAEIINSNLESYLERFGIDTGKPFRCLSPDHEDIHPSMVYNRRTNRCHCYACGVTYDLIDIIGLTYHKWDAKEAFKLACEIYLNYGGGSVSPRRPPSKPVSADTDEQDYSEFFSEAAAHLDETDYHRGISLRTLNRFNCGFSPEWQHPKSLAEGKNPPASPRLIIPTGKGSYIARDTRKDLTEKQNEFKKQKVGKTHIFNCDALSSAEQPVFIVEGEIDALSIIDVGGNAIGLGSITMVSRFLDVLKQIRPSVPLIIALDNEENEQVKNAAEKLYAGISKLGLYAVNASPYGNYKDANDALNADRLAFADEIYRIEKAAMLSSSYESAPQNGKEI